MLQVSLLGLERDGRLLPRSSHALPSGHVCVHDTFNSLHIKLGSTLMISL